MPSDPTVSLRAATAADLPHIHAVVVESDAFDGVPVRVTLTEIEEELDDEAVSLADDVRVAVDGEGLVVGYAHTLHLPSDVGQERCYVIGDVRPAWRGRGVGTALLAWGRDRAEVQLRSSGTTLPKFVRVDAYDYCAADHRLFARLGFRPVRYFEELLRPLDDVSTATPSLPPAGVRVVPWPAQRQEEIRRLRNETFADHWGSTPMSEQRWAQVVTGHGACPGCSFVALDADDRIVGFSWNTRYPDDDEITGRSDGWIQMLGVARTWRGQGVASALIAASLRAFADAGFTHASIGVDSDSPTGAARLYRALGFEPRQRSITYEIEVG